MFLKFCIFPSHSSIYIEKLACQKEIQAYIESYYVWNKLGNYLKKFPVKAFGGGTSFEKVCRRLRWKRWV